MSDSFLPMTLLAACMPPTHGYPPWAATCKTFSLIPCRRHYSSFGPYGVHVGLSFSTSENPDLLPFAAPPSEPPPRTHPVGSTTGATTPQRCGAVRRPMGCAAGTQFGCVCAGLCGRPPGCRRGRAGRFEPPVPFDNRPAGFADWVVVPKGQALSVQGRHVGCRIVVEGAYIQG